jgi:hypothetical protein
MFSAFVCPFIRRLALPLLAACLGLGGVSCATLQTLDVVADMDRGIEADVADKLVALPGAGEHTRPEAEKIARVAVQSSREQAAKYGVLIPGWMHNTLVNTGFKDRGLCWQWMEDLYPKLRFLESRHFTFVCGVRDPGKPREHHCVVAVPRGRPFEDGLVLDPWAGGGMLKAFPVRGASRKWHYDHHWTEPLQRYYADGTRRTPPPRR